MISRRSYTLISVTKQIDPYKHFIKYTFTCKNVIFLNYFFVALRNIMQRLQCGRKIARAVIMKKALPAHNTTLY
jgi:hypothetical protein